MFCSLNDYLQEELGSFKGARKSVVSDHFSPPRRRLPIPLSGCGGFRWEWWGGGELGGGVVKADGVSFDLFLLKAAVCNSSFFLDLARLTLGGCEGQMSMGQMSTPGDIRVCLTH